MKGKKDKNYHLTWQDGVKDAEDIGPQVHYLHADGAELGDAQAHKNVIRIKQAAQDLWGEK